MTAQKRKSISEAHEPPESETTSKRTRLSVRTNTSNPTLQPNNKAMSENTNLSTSDTTSDSDSAPLSPSSSSDSDSDPPSSPSSDSYQEKDEDEVEEDEPIPLGFPPKPTMTLPPSFLSNSDDLRSRLATLLPQLKAANTDLEGRTAEELDLENLEEDEERWIEMELGVGVLEEKRGRDGEGGDGRMSEESEGGSESVEEEEGDGEGEDEERVGRMGGSTMRGEDGGGEKRRVRTRRRVLEKLLGVSREQGKGGGIQVVQEGEEV